jgi:SAM-dependent methyltransferase
MKLSYNFQLGRYFTFEPSKSRPIYNWFYYKEAFSPELVFHFIEKWKPKNILDPFCGIGTTLLASKEKSIPAYGMDVSPLAVFVSRVKTEHYTENDVEEGWWALRDFFENRTIPSYEWEFELFSPKKFFPPRNYNDIVFIREKIETIENEKIKNLFLLALLSIVPQCGLFIKDGGVLKFSKEKRAMPVKEAFRRKVKRMLREARETKPGEVFVEEGDARFMEFENGFDGIITSPPYLNNVDYTKVYGLELSLLAMDKNIPSLVREKSFRSFIKKDTKPREILPEVEEYSSLPIVLAYFEDSKMVFENFYRALREGGKVAYVVGNAVIHETHIPVDEILCRIAERIGFETEIIVGLERVADVRPARIKTRESVVFLEKI